MQEKMILDYRSGTNPSKSPNDPKSQVHLGVGHGIVNAIRPHINIQPETTPGADTTGQYVDVTRKYSSLFIKETRDDHAFTTGIWLGLSGRHDERK
jgi:hypothetical protein